MLQDSGTNEALCGQDIKAYLKDMPIPNKMNHFPGWKRSVNSLWHGQLVLPRGSALFGLSFDPFPDGWDISQWLWLDQLWGLHYWGQHDLHSCYHDFILLIIVVVWGTQTGTSWCQMTMPRSLPGRYSVSHYGHSLVGINLQTPVLLLGATSTMCIPASYASLSWNSWFLPNPLHK